MQWSEASSVRWVVGLVSEEFILLGHQASSITLAFLSIAARKSKSVKYLSTVKYVNAILTNRVRFFQNNHGEVPMTNDSSLTAINTGCCILNQHHSSLEEGITAF